jgi:hypothetical protein
MQNLSHAYFLLELFQSLLLISQSIACQAFVVVDTKREKVFAGQTCGIHVCSEFEALFTAGGAGDTWW